MAIDSILKKNSTITVKNTPHPEAKVFVSTYSALSRRRVCWLAKGAKFVHEQTNFEILGKFDDVGVAMMAPSFIWQTTKGAVMLLVLVCFIKVFAIKWIFIFGLPRRLITVFPTEASFTIKS